MTTLLASGAGLDEPSIGLVPREVPEPLRAQVRIRVEAHGLRHAEAVRAERFPLIYLSAYLQAHGQRALLPVLTVSGW